MSARNDPAVSVVIATYNRSRVVGHAVRSVLDSDLENSEVIVVGDQCTDDTAAAIEAIGDPRVRFVNLERHTGDQSAPNNRGIELARAPIIALLNHDDLYFADHLRRGLEHLERTGADLVWTPTLIIEPTDEAIREQRKWVVRVGSTPPRGIYDARVACPASSWILKRQFAARAGPWRPSSELYIFPSQDWLFRAWRSGARLSFYPHPGVLVLYSGPRPNSYRLDDGREHDFFAREVREQPGFREELLASAAVAQAGILAGRVQGRTRAARALAFLEKPLLALGVRVGIHPRVPHQALRYGKGGITRNHRRMVGLASESEEST